MKGRKRPKESGHSLRKKKMKRDKEAAALSGSMNKFLTLQNDPSSSTSQQNIEESKSESNESSHSDVTVTESEKQTDDEQTESEVETHDSEMIISQSETENFETQVETPESEAVNPEIQIEINKGPIEHDPYTWPDVLSASFREQIAKSGLPPTPNQGKIYPSHGGRSFQSSYFYGIHTSGANYKRDWLIYSDSSDSVYCLFCAIFNRNANLFCSIGRGYSDWKNIKRNLSTHETTFKHYEAFKDWHELCKRLELNKTINAEQMKLLDKETDHWKEVIKRLVASVQYLAQQSLAFRGISDKLYEKNNGNFLKLIEMLAKFDPVMKDHLHRATTTKKRHYLSKTIQNELIECLATSVTDYISDAVEKSIYFSIMVDCTSDLAHVEQTSIILRYVSLCPIQNKFKIDERFLSFSAIHDTTGLGITNTIIAQLNKFKLNVQNLRGQGYDNGANMVGIVKGVQNRILEINSRALFVPCACHKLNLMVNDTAKLIDNQAFKFFNIVQDCFVFFSESTKRWGILQNFAESEKITLKNVSTTRWSSREEATKCLLFNLPKIAAALDEIANSGKRDKTIFEAKNLSKRIKKFKFICMVVVWHNVLSKINIVSKSLQSHSINIAKCLELITGLEEYLKKVREDQTIVDGWFENAKKIQDEIKHNEAQLEDMGIVDIVNIDERSTRSGTSNQEDFCEADRYKFRTSFVFPILDIASKRLQERFKHLTEITNVFGFLFDLFSLNITINQCEELEKALTSKDGQKDVNAAVLLDEIKSFQILIHNDGEKSPLEFLNKIYDCGFEPIFKNLVIALKIVLTLPVTIATAESSFSKLKIIENYLRTTMSQERLSALATISIESELLELIPMEAIIKKFAAAKARQVVFN